MNFFTKTILFGLLSFIAFNLNAQSTFPIVPGSVIAVGNDDNVLRNWLDDYGQAPKGTLLYRRSMHGASSYTFHNRVDEKGPTLVIFKASNGQVFGGYSPNSWSSTSTGYRNSSDAFLFNLNSNRKASPRYPQYSIYTNNSYGPTFGGGHDIYINSSMNGGYLRPHSYNNVDGSGVYPETSTMLNLAGVTPNSSYNRYYFGNGFITEIEVYQIEYNSSAPNIQGQDIIVSLDANGQASITPQDIDTGTTDPDGTVTLEIDINSFNCDNLGGNSEAITPVNIGSVSQPTQSHGGGFNPHTREFWYPQWSGRNVYVYDENHNYLRAFDSGQNQIMQLWMDLDSETDYYTANWGYNTITKRSGSTTVWTYNMGATAASVSADADYVYAYGAWQNYIRVLDKNTGAFVRNINIPGSIYGYGTLVIANEHIYMAGRANGWSTNPYNYQYVHQMDMDGNYIGSTYSGRNAYNMAFDGETMWISDNGNTINGVKIAEGNAYEGSGGSNAVALTATDPLGNSRSQTFSVTVEDHIAPTITLNGGAQMSVNSDTDENASFETLEPGATPSDNCTAEVEITGTVDIATPGVYTLSYKAVDQSGNESASVTREVTVIDASAPVAKAGRITVELDANGNATVDPASLNNGSSDNGNATLTYTLDRTAFDCNDLNAEGGSTGGSPVNMSLVGTATIDTKSHGGGYNPNTNEFWYPEWYNNGYQGTIYIYDENRQFLRTINAGQGQKMQLWMDPDSDSEFYTANWTISSPYFYAKYDVNGQEIWKYNNANGNYPSGISTDTDYAYVLAYGGNRIDVLDKNTGQLQRSITLPGQVYIYGGLVIANEQIYIAGQANGWSTNPNDMRYVHQLDMDGNYQSSISTNGVYPYNMAFDGEVMWVSQNSSAVTGIKISDGSAYGASGGVPVTLTVTDELGNFATDEGAVVVVDLIAPTVALNGDATLEVPQGDTFTDPATASDNCSASIEITGTVDVNTLGSYTLTYKAVDDSGNKSKSVTRTVTVVPANEPPIAVCQSIEVGVGENCQATVVATDFDGGSMDPDGDALTLSIAPVGPFAIGEHTVVLTVTDPKGESSSCEAILTIIDSQSPTVTASGAVVTTTSADGTGDCTVAIAIVDATFDDNCESNLTWVMTGAVDATGTDQVEVYAFPIGTTTITYTNTDGAALAASSAMNVTVSDDETPTVSAAGDVVTTTSADGVGNCTVLVSIANATFDDNCESNLTWVMTGEVNDHGAGQVGDYTFPIGTTTITYTNTDGAALAASSAMNVTVSDDETPTVSAAGDVVTTTSADGVGNCTVLVSIANATFDDNCESNLTWVMTGEVNDHGAGQVGDYTFPIGTTTITYTNTDGAALAASSAMNVTVSDDETPTVSAAGDVVTTTSADGVGNCTVLVSIANATFDDNCESNLTWIMTGEVNDHGTGQVGDYTFPIGTTTITYTNTDGAALAASSAMNVTVSDDETPTVSAAGDVVTTTSADGVGNCTVLVSIANAMFDDNCESNLTWIMTGEVNDHGTGQVGDYTFPIGTTTITYTNTDGAALAASSAMNVTVSDDETPTVSAAGDVVTTTSADGVGNCTVLVSIANATFDDNCESNLTWVMTGAVDATGTDQVEVYAFPIGTTTITYTNTDGAGNDASSAMTVTVTDDEKPTVSAAANVVTTTSADDTGDCTVEVAIEDALLGDNCESNLTWVMTGEVNDHGAGQVGDYTFPIGTTTITYTNTDGAALAASSAMNVTVSDDETPTVSAAGDVVTTTSADGVGNCTVLVSIANATFDDNCESNLTWVMTGEVNDHGAGQVGDYTFPIGTTTITYTNTDGAALAASSAMNVTVSDDETPAVSAAGDVVTTTSADGVGNCTVLVSIANATFDDNCESNLTWVMTGEVNDHGAGQVGDYTFPIGTTTITYTNTDGAALAASSAMNVTVSDDETPAVSAAGDVVTTTSADGVGNCTVLVSIANATFDDNCESNLTWVMTGEVNDHGAGQVGDYTFPIGTTTITYTNTDGAALAASSAMNVTVSDDETPAVSAAGDVVTTTSADGVGNCTVLVSIANATFDDNCESNLTWVMTGEVNDHGAGQVGDYTFPIGTTTITYSNTDGAALAASSAMEVTVIDDEKPSLTVPADIFVCENDIVTYTIPVGTDNCSAITTQTLGLPLTNGSVFPVGVTTITYTAEDPSGNFISRSFDVTVRALPTVEIVQSELDPYCQGGAIVLSADAPDAVAYDWSNADESSSTEVFTSGSYTLTITNQYGCENTASSDVDYVAEDLLSAYTIIATKEVHLHENNTVLNGGVGVMDARKKAKIDDNTIIDAATTFVMADKIEVKDGSSVTTQINDQPTVTLPTFLYGAPGKNDVKIKDNEVITLTGTAYKKVDVKKNATVIFTQSDVSIKELHIGENSTVKFDGCTYLRIEKKMHLHKNNAFNPDNYKVNVFIEDGNADIHEGTTFNGSIYALNHEIKVKGKNNNPSFMTGFFIAEKIKGEKNVVWDWNTNCSQKGCPDIIQNKTFQSVDVADVKIDNKQFNVLAYPNPYLSEFSIELNTDSKSEVSISIYDLLGKQVELHESLDPISIPRFGRNLTSGLYMVAITQNGHTEIIKVNKIDQ